MKSLFEEMGGTYRQVGDYLIPNLVLSDDSLEILLRCGSKCFSFLENVR